MITLHCKCENGYSMRVELSCSWSDGDILEAYLGRPMSTGSAYFKGYSKCIAVTIERSAS